MATKVESRLLAINEPAMDDKILQLNNEIDVIMRSLNEIQNKMYELKDYFKGDVANGIQDKFKTISDQYDTFKANLNSYSRDLTNIKSMMIKIDEQSKQFFEEKSDEVITDRANAEAELEEGRAAQNKIMSDAIAAAQITRVKPDLKEDNINDK